MKIKNLLLLAIPLFSLLQSCSINADTAYHKDATSSVLLNMDMTEALNVMQSMGDSSMAQSPVDISKYPKDWESLYTVEKKTAEKKGEKYGPVGDSAAVMKKIFTKIILDEKGEMNGFSLKYDRLTNDEIKIFSKLNSKKDPLTSADFMQWDGKKLVLNLDQINADALMKDSKPGSKGEINQMSDMLKMFKMTYSNTIKFDQKIAKIEGKHDWISQKDDHSILLNIDVAKLTDPDSKFKIQK